jgi:hypothetical protein
MTPSDQEDGFSSKRREELFISLSKQKNGATAQDVFEAGKSKGDGVTIEAYHNLGRRLVHRGILVSDKSDRQTRYTLSDRGEEQWLDDDQIATIVNPEYPLIALAVVEESVRQLNSVPESAWQEVRERLKHVKARNLFADAICGYCQNLKDEVENYVLEETRSSQPADLSRLRQKIQSELSMLKGLVKFGLGLSKQAVPLPQTFDAAVAEWKKNGDKTHFCNKAELESELSQRVEDGMAIADAEIVDEAPELFIAAVDGSSRSGLLSPEGGQGDFTVGSFPLVSINTAVAQVNRIVKSGNSTSPAFLRLPEKPEDMQQSDNRHTIMAKLFYPDITDGEYIHSVWNAMDVLESKATLRVLKRWYTSKSNVEIQPADLVLRDGTVTPQDRDFSHYIQQDSYGKIVRDLIEANWEVVKKCRDDGQTVVGIVKTANLRVVAPVVNWFVCQLIASSANSQIQSWPLQTMNLVTDQVLLSRLLTAGRKKGDPWTRTCLVLRPFHSTTKFAEDYSKAIGETPAAKILGRAQSAASGDSSDSQREDSWLKGREFRGNKDSYVQMLQNCWYASTYVGAVPRLDLNNVLPRCEFLLPTSTNEGVVYPLDEVTAHLHRVLVGLKTIKFDVSADHSMFKTLLKIDVLPSLLIRVHENVKIWAAELVSKVNEVIGYYISRHVNTGARRGVRVRPWTAAELKTFAMQLQTERNLQAGAVNDPSRQIDETERE